MLALLGILCLVLAGCSGGSGDSTGVASSAYLEESSPSSHTHTASYEDAARASNENTIEITNSKTFDPNALTIEFMSSDYGGGGGCWPCPQVTWINNDDRPHTVTSDSGLFDSGPIGPGGQWSFTFIAPGEHEYHCSYHDSMVGSISLVEAEEKSS